MAHDAGELAAPQVVAKQSGGAGGPDCFRPRSLSFGGQVAAVLSVMTLREARLISFGQVL
jgi:hypothetical protein